MINDGLEIARAKAWNQVGQNINHCIDCKVPMHLQEWVGLRLGIKIGMQVWWQIADRLKAQSWEEVFNDIKGEFQ